MIIIDIDKPKRCGQCPMHNDGTDYCKLEHDHASFVRARGCPIKTINPQEPKTGRWVKISPADIYECSTCGQNVMTQDIKAYKFCNGCGAKMEGGQNDN